MGGVSALLLRLGDEVFGLDVATVREVVVAPRVTALPTAPPSVVGVFNLRGAVLPVLDTGRLLDGEVLRDSAFAVVVRCWEHDAALMVPAIPTMARLGAAVQPSETTGTSGTYLAGDQLVTMIDPELLLGHAGLGAEQHRQTAG